MQHAIPVDTARFAHLYPFRSHYFDINGLRYHYLFEGRGAPMLMVHGNPTWSFFFRNLVTAFSDQYQVIVPDHIGCGLSDKPGYNQYDFRLQSRVNDLTAFMEHLTLKRPITLIIHDWGGIIGLAWALHHLDQVRRIVIMNTAGFFPPQNKSIPWRLRLIRKPNPVMNWLVTHLNLFARAALHMAPFKRLRSDVKAGLIAPYNCPRNRLAILKFVQDIPLRSSDPSGNIVTHVSKNLDRLKDLPVMILWGAHDFVFTKAYYDEWQRRLPNAKAHWFDNAGHYLLEDIPEKIIDCINQFLHNY